MQPQNAPKRKSLRDQLKLSLNKQREALSTEKENNPRPIPRDSKAKAILIDNYSCSPEHGDRTKRAKSRLCKQIRRIAIDRSEKQVRLAKRCQELILLARNFVNSSGRVLKLFSESTRENDINLKIFISQKYSLTEYLEDLDKQVSNIKSEDIDLSKENEELKHEIDRLSRALKKDQKEVPVKDSRERLTQDLRKDQLNTIKKFIKERVQHLEGEFSKLLQFTDKEYKLRLILLGREKQLTREKEIQLGEMIQFVRGQCEQHLLGKQSSERLPQQVERSQDKAVTYKVRELLKYLKVQYSESRPANTLSLLEMLQLKLYNLKIELIPTIKRQNEAYAKEIKQLKADLDGQMQEGRRMSVNKTNLASLEEEVKMLKEELLKIEGLRQLKQPSKEVVRQPQYFTHQQRGMERQKLERQILELEREKNRLEGIVNRVFEQLQTVCVSNNLIKRQELRDLNYQGLMDVLQKSISQGKDKDKEQKQRDAREKRRIQNQGKIASVRVAELQKEKLAVVRAFSNLEQQFEMLLAQKLYLEEHVDRMRATHQTDQEQLQQEFKLVQEELQSRLRRPQSSELQTQTILETTMLNQIIAEKDTLNDTINLQNEQLSRRAAQISELFEKQEFLLTSIEELNSQIIENTNVLADAQSSITQMNNQKQQLLSNIQERDKKFIEAETCINKIKEQLEVTSNSLQQNTKTIEIQLETIRLLEFEVDTVNRGQQVLKQQIAHSQTVISDRNNLIESLNMQVIKLVEAENILRHNHSSVTSELSESKFALNDLQSAYQVIQAELTYKQEQLQKVEAQLNSLKLDAHAKITQIETLRDSSEKTASELQSAQLQAEFVSRLENDIEELRKENSEKTDEISRLKHQAITIMILTEENGHLKAELLEKETTIKDLDDQLTGQIRLKEECSHLRQVLEESGSKLSISEMQVNSLTQQLSKLKDELVALKQEQNSRLTEIHEACSSFESMITKTQQLIGNKLTALYEKLSISATSISSALNHQGARKQEHYKTKSLLGQYSVSCSQLQVEINKLVDQLEGVQGKYKNQSSRLLEEALRSSQKLKTEQNLMKKSYQLELQASRLTISEQQEKLKMYQGQLNSAFQNSGTPYKSQNENYTSNVLNSCSQMLDFNNLNGCQDMQVQTDDTKKIVEQKHERKIKQLKQFIIATLHQYRMWMVGNYEEASKEFKEILDRQAEKGMQLVVAVGKKFKINYNDEQTIVEQTVRFVNQFQIQRKEGHSNYFEVLEKLVEELLCNRVSLNLQQQIKTLQPADKEKILGYRKKIADLQFQLSQKDELNDKIKQHETQIINLKSEAKSKDKRIGFYESEVQEKEKVILELKERKIFEPNISESQPQLFLIQDDLLDKQLSGSAEALHDLLDQSGICSDELAFTKSQLTRCVKDNSVLKEKLRGGRHHLKRIVDLIEGHSGGQETNARIYEALLNCRSSLS